MTLTLISPATRARFKRLGEPIAVALGRLGFTPNGLTFTGFAITIVGACLVAAQAWAAAGVVVFLGGFFDMFDGALARATGRVSSAGAFMDSVFDRSGEAVVYVGIVAGCVAAGFGPGEILAASAMAAAFLVSYARAKAEGLGFEKGTGMAAVGLAPREIRLVILAIGLLATGLAGGVGPALLPSTQLDQLTPPGPPGEPWLAGTLGLITLLSTITVIQRIVHVLQQARKAE